MRKLIVALSLVAGINACKTAEMGSGSTLAAGREGQFCGTFNLKEMTDPAERERTVRFLVDMWLKGNARAGILLGAFLYDMTPEQFLREVNAAAKGELLVGETNGKLTEKDVASIEIERRIQEKLMAPLLGAADGLIMSKGPLDAALFKTKLSELASASAQSQLNGRPDTAREVQNAIDMIRSAMDYETTLTDADIKGEGNVPTGANVRKFARERKFVGMSAALEMLNAKLATWGAKPNEVASKQSEALMEGMRAAWVEHVREGMRAQNAQTYVVTANIWRAEMAKLLQGRDGQVDKEALERTGIDKMIERLKNQAEREKFAKLSDVEAKAELERSLDFRGAREAMERKGVSINRDAFERMRLAR